MKYSTKFELHPAVALLLIVLAVFGIDLMWTQQRKQKRAANQPTRPTAQPSSRMPPAQPVASKPPAPARAPIMPEPGTVTVERDAPTSRPRSPFGNRPVRPDVEARVAEKIAGMNAEVKSAAMNGANAYVQQHQ